MYSHCSLLVTFIVTNIFVIVRLMGSGKSIHCYNNSSGSKV